MACVDDLTQLDLNELDPTTTNLPSNGSQTTISLFPFILLDQSHGSNVASNSNLNFIIRPLDTKDLVITEEESTGFCLDSQEGDDELIIHVRFSELVRIKSILIGTGGGRSGTSPRQVKVWVNRANGINFDETAEVTEGGTKADQEWELLEGEGGKRGSTDYPVRMSKFSNVSSIDLFFHNTSSATSTRLFYLGFMGEAKSLKKDPRTDMTVAAEQGVGSLVDSIKEKTGGNLASVR